MGEIVANYKCCSEKLKEEKEALEAVKMDLEHQLGEARSRAEGEAERSTKADD